MLLAVVVLVQGRPRRRFPLGASFSPSTIFVGGFTGAAGIALAFAFASFIGFEATAIYGEESQGPQADGAAGDLPRRRCHHPAVRADHLRVVTGLGYENVVAETVKRSTVDGTPLANPAAVVFSSPSSTSAAGCPP